MAFIRTGVIILALLAGWAAVRTQSLAQPSPTAIVQAP